MGSDHIEIRVNPPPPPVQHFERLIEEPSPDVVPQKIAPDDLLLMGMMLYMEQGMVLEWLKPERKREEGDEDTEHR
jgi:hypothetical protein